MLNPFLYPVLELDLRRVNLRRFPYALFFIVEGDQVTVLACFHQHRKPLTRKDLSGP
ncbi:hypothetical protein [Pelomonas sp. SE-A7]|uniref:hypothetical protein n=1 Tax=Pelomonas sp. SE-A7 TaxID=3054953 RepID=UPI00259D15DC|nr:hypothetical protein [Pelomonas sp. SE-A7]MDM4766249.1 hypothetical protein [Pelomonas sp. SE-A7]